MNIHKPFQIRKEKGMLKRIRIYLVALLLLFSFGQQAHALLNAVGPVDPVNGFPTYYQDTSGLGLAPCMSTLPSSVAGAGFMCVLLPDPGYNPALPITFPSNFPLELFYWIADSVNLGNNVKVMRFALEGTFSTPTVTPGQQMTFTRIRMKILPPDPSATYTVTHPFGVKVLTPADSKDSAGFFYFSEDIPPGAIGDFAGAVNGNIGPFMTWDPAILPAAPAGFIGDPGLPHKVTGSPFGTNYVRIEGPNIGGPGVHFVQSDVFTIAGQKFAGPLPTPLAVTGVNYSRTIPGQVDVFATSTPTATLSITGAASLPVTPQFMTGDGRGNFFASIAVPNASVLPPSLTVTASMPPNIDVTATGFLKDIVTITKASYNLVSKTLSILASSSDKSPTNRPVLNAVGFGQVVAGALTLPGVPLPPPTVTVISSSGGSDTKAVTLVAAAPPPTAPPVAVNDTVVTNVNTPVVIRVKTNDTGLLTPPGTVSLVSAPLHGTALVNPAGTITYTPNPAFVGSDTLTYTVTGPGGASNVGTVTITISPITEVITVTGAQYTTASKLWTISGTTSLPRATMSAFNSGDLAPPLIGTGVAGGAGTWTIKVKPSPVAPNVARVISIQSSGGGTALNVPITIK